MLLNSFKSYEKQPKAKFANGEKVYLDFNQKRENDPSKIEGPYIVKSSNLSIAGIYMYSFTDYGAGVGEIYLKRATEDTKLTISDCIHEPKSTINVREMYEAGDKLIGHRASADGTYGVDFFNPDNNMLKWLVQYANGRTILDVGCGTGRVTIWLKQYGANIVGIDPELDPSGIAKNQIESILANDTFPHFICKKIQDMPTLIQGAGDKILILMARPSSSGYVEDVLDMKDDNTEVLYCTTQSTWEKENHLGDYRSIAKKIEPEGRSVEKEVFYSIL